MDAIPFPLQALVVVVGGVYLLKHLRRMGGGQQMTVANGGLTAITHFVGLREFNDGIKRMERDGWEYIAHTETLIGRGGSKWVIGFFAAQRVRYTVQFRRTLGH
jgi:hypothetical protein